MIMHPKRLFPTSVEELLYITARLANTSKKDFNKNLEEIETSNIYCDVYTLAEMGEDWLKDYLRELNDKEMYRACM